MKCILTLLFSVVVWTHVNAQDEQAELVATGDNVIPARLAVESVLLDIAEISTEAGTRLVAVGERGHILLSDDAGESWQQSTRVPTRSMLTAIASVNQQVWAVGHNSTILLSEDAGNSWAIQAEEIGGDPLMDVRFESTGQGIAVGAYGLYMHTDNWGTDWATELLGDLVTAAPQPQEQQTTAEQDSDSTFNDSGFIDQDALSDYEDLDVDYHLNAIERLDANRLVIAAEAGRGYLSQDNGVSWTKFRLPYDGSMFGLTQVNNGRCVIMYGLRGNAFIGCDSLTDWQAVATKSSASLFGSSRDGSTTLWMVGANGTLLKADAQQQFTRIPLNEGDDLVDLEVLGEQLIIVGETGVQKQNLAAVNSSVEQ